MKRIVFATHNPGKVIEMRQMLEWLPIEVLSADEVGVMEDVVEDAETFAENALKKAQFVAQKSGEWAVADDSGIMIDALGGRPGVHSRRWAGEDVNDKGLLEFTLRALEDVEEGGRGATFQSSVALVSPAGEEHVFEATLTGTITTGPRGTPRPKLPYDLLFCPIGHNRTFAEMSDQEKNSLSHRGLAFEKLKFFIKTSLGDV